MTEEEAKKLRAGDAVLIIGTVVQNDGTDKLPVEVEVEGLDNFWPYPRTIHSATPRPLEVGAVTTKGEIVAIHGETAWVVGGFDPQQALCSLDSLVRVDD